MSDVRSKSLLKQPSFSALRAGGTRFLRTAVALEPGMRPALLTGMVHNFHAQDVRDIFGAASSVTLHATASEHRPRCWIASKGIHCTRLSALRITDGSWDGYIYTCVAHVEVVLLSRPSSTVEPIPREA